MRSSLALLILGCLCSWLDFAAAADPPHVLCIMTDDLGWQDLHCQGNPVLQTPHIDGLAKDGVRFTNAYAASPVCSPTRAAMMTGLAPARLHITQHGPDGQQFWPKDRRVQPPPSKHELWHETTTLAERLKTAGYATGFFGKWHLGGDEKYWPMQHGFDVNVGGCGFGGPPTYFDPYRIPTLPPRETGEYLTDRLADETIAFLHSAKDQPMFICLWTYNPHYPFEAPDELTAHYQGKQGPGLKNPIYGGQIEATDRAIGRVLQELESLGIAEQTLVIFTSDNGGWSGATDNRPLREGKGYLYEGGLRVPLIVRWPGVTKAGTVNPTPVVSMDLTATMLDAAAVRLAENESLDGESLRPLFAGGKLKRDALYFHYPHFAFHKANRPGSAIRSGQHKLIYRYDDDSVQLFDLDHDLGETTDLADIHPDVAGNLKDRLTDWLQTTDAGLPVQRK
ncbi:Arylsulfatase [Rubripirellula lacrimiformis]|uniref:Arylsulfatase n=1 Tax=Rubripirellula lacrimiformis TaxID=1930273 RepID=A0A517NJJ7_9BACT|nr:sulfatase [Rubripirellula lacrimiformis]QDT07308.1 Arylsulfatase [Rubripirellula lacrimiformis]